MRLPYGTSLDARARSRLLVGEALASANVLGERAGRPVAKRRHLALRRAVRAIQLRRLGPWVKRRQTFTCERPHKPFAWSRS